MVDKDGTITEDATKQAYLAERKRRRKGGSVTFFVFTCQRQLV